ncbi:MAG: hypothetical protein LBC97_04465 [Bifidobacteriaceae bacterium]|nr:hypothetical protein [Bifidobacteriaceae bacterium]
MDRDRPFGVGGAFEARHLMAGFGSLPFSVTTVPNSDTRRALAEARADEGLSDPFQSANDMIDAAVADA